MSTRASIIIKDETQTLYFYRHSDGYPECAGADLADFVKGYAEEGGTMRADVGQSAGWLIVRGHAEYSKDQKMFTGRPNASDRSMGWKVGAYEPATDLHGDVEYVYIIDLVARTLTCRVPNKKFWDKPTLANTTASKKFGPVPFDPPPERTDESIVEALASEVERLYASPSSEGRTVLALDPAVKAILKAADVGPERETRRDFDGVSAAEFMVHKMIAEIVSTGAVNL